MSEYNSEDDSDGLDLTRRGLLGLTGLTAAGLISTVGTGNAAAAGDPLYIDGSNSMEQDLGLGTNSIVDVDNVEAGHDYASFSSSGTGNGHLQLFDTNANTHHLRTIEGSEPTDGERTAPGPIEIQSPIMGAPEDAPGTPDPGPLRIKNETVADSLDASSVSVRNWNLVDVVAEPAIDENADLGKEIQSYLNDRSTINHLFVLPAGTYTWNTAIDQDTFEYIGVVGKPHATLKMDTNEASLGFNLGTRSGGGKRATLRNLTLDIDRTDPDGDNIDAGFVVAHIEESLELIDLELKGQRHYLLPNSDKQGDESRVNSDKQGDKFTVLSQLLTEDGVGKIHNVTLSYGEVERDPDDYDSDDHATPFSADPAHVGTNFWSGCYVEDFVDNGFYVQNSPGRNVITGCTAKNTSAGSIRLGANDICRDSTIIIDDAPRHNVRGLWLKHNETGDKESQEYSPRAENVKIYARDAPTGQLLDINGKGGIVRNVDIIRGTSNDRSAVSHTVDVACNKEVTLENIRVHEEFTYEEEEEYQRIFAVVISAPEATVRNFDLEIEAEKDRPGIAFDSQFGHLQNCSVDIPNDEDAVEVRSSESSIVNCRFKAKNEANPTFELYPDVDLESLHIRGCRFIDVQLKRLTKSDISQGNIFKTTTSEE